MKYLLLATLSFLIAACSNQEKTAENKAKTVEPALVKSDVKDNVKDKKGSTSAPNKSPGKPSAPISLEYSFEGQPTLGKPLNVRVKLKGNQQASPVKASVKYSPSLITTKPIAKLNFKSSSPKDSEIVTITPTENGIYFINIQAST